MGRDRYLSYLLRLWQTSDDEELSWHASLECPETRQRRGFACPEDMFGFLQAQMQPQEEREGKERREK